VLVINLFDRNSKPSSTLLIMGGSNGPTDSRVCRREELAFF